MIKIRWSSRAIGDVTKIYDYIFEQGFSVYALSQIEKLFLSVGKLSSFPHIGRRLPEFPSFPHREVIVNPYRVIYRYDQSSNEIRIITVIHSKRLMKNISL